MRVRKSARLINLGERHNWGYTAVWQDDSERHLAERLQRLVVMDAITQVYLYAGVQLLNQLALN